MIEVIGEKLKEIEEQQQIRILFACESGSRGWGFPSPDSDYDVRFIYTHPADHYLTVQKRSDQFTFPITDELDINGWDISKTLQLITRSNTTPFEWIQSPVIYRSDETVRKEILAISKYYFCARSSTHHYLGVAKNAMGSLYGDEIKIKKLFYLVRSLLSALWNVRKKEIAPMHIDPLLDLLSGGLQKEIRELITLKAGQAEGFPVQLSPELRDWIEETFVFCEASSLLLEKKTYDPEPADVLFRNIIRQYDHSGDKG